MTDIPQDLLFLQWLIDECGYKDPKPISGNRYACILRKTFTHAIITGIIGDKYTISDNWCYQNYNDAKLALDEWNGTDEPKGWHRHPGTGRRVSISKTEIDGEGNLINEIGIAYQRD